MILALVSTILLLGPKSSAKRYRGTTWHVASNAPIARQSWLFVVYLVIFYSRFFD
jgi:hypothetical protein